MSAVFPINADTRFRISTAAGGETSFSIAFPWQDDADISVIKIAADGTETILANPADYTLTGAGVPAGGTLNLVVAAVAGEQYLRLGAALLTRITSIVRSGKYNSKALDDDIDRFILIAQELVRDADRAVKVDYGSSGFGVSQGAEGEVLAFDANGDMVPVSALGIDPKGAWSVATAYVKNDVVDYGSNLWLARRDNVGVTPVAGDDWLLFLAGGSVPDGSITTTKLAADAVTTAKIIDGAVAGAKLAADAVTTTKIIDGAVTGAKLAPTLYALPNEPVADLREFMDLQYGVGLWTYRTGVGVGSDAGLAMTAALQALRSRYGRGVLRIPPTGNFLVTTPPSHTDMSGHYIIGYGSQASAVTINKSTGVGFYFSGASGYTGGGVRSLAIFLEDGFGSTGTTQAIIAQGDASYQGDQMELSDLYITSHGAASYWYNGIYYYGVARTTPQGIRVGQWNNIQLFQCRNLGVYLGNVVQLSINNMGIYAGTGTGRDLYIAGGGSPLTNSIQIDIRNLTCNNINATNATKCAIQGHINQFITNTTFDQYDLSLSVAVAMSGTLGSRGRNLQY